MIKAKLIINLIISFKKPKFLLYEKYYELHFQTFHDEIKVK